MPQRWATFVFRDKSNVAQPVEQTDEGSERNQNDRCNVAGRKSPRCAPSAELPNPGFKASPLPPGKEKVRGNNRAAIQ
ncbi:hypothetical protein TWF569_009921 [Orbilia oligospora]|uniref:Uncharacterized protein n=1 Tax=Orbilia oligospora TaxID=2813651 RepID=A0A7C8N8X9_ORBOL|nr:hypothetical protein TWF706_011938 [Orbilia oligospora]KAF3095893.1 hypothetical protein TWF102_006879 [Orbilia oligospora]KAF3105536.1 hypothetical protein TWF103_006596 [Orbilia oligospora]KAF3135586.1 hypothetical protein TWF569_009921 [Orbilia oligospora]KAF3142529.1 hypothetical protein TWF594_005427 [Orbilia oligospora]